jgi:ATP adenylyltransferase
MNAKELRDFINSKMSVSHIYQPMIVLSLLEHGGEVSTQSVAQKCAELKGDTKEAFAQRLVKYPKEALLKHGVLMPSTRETFKLAVDRSELTSDINAELVKVCKERLQKVK